MLMSMLAIKIKQYIICSIYWVNERGNGHQKFHSSSLMWRLNSFYISKLDHANSKKIRKWKFYDKNSVVWNYINAWSLLALSMFVGSEKCI